MRIVATPLTSGNATPGKEQPGGYYRFQRDPTWTPNDPRYRDPEPDPQADGHTARTARRKERLVEFAAILKEAGYPDPGTAPSKAVQEAGRRLGLAPKTARSYRATLKQQGEIR